MRLSLAFSLRKPVCGVAAAAALLALSPAGPARAAGPFDGAWSVLVITQSGNCDQAYRYPLRVDNGRVTYGGSGDFTISGAVAGNGAVNVSIRRGEQGANGSGRLGARNGSGQWSGKSSTGACSGRWEAQKQ